MSEGIKVATVFVVMIGIVLLSMALVAPWIVRLMQWVDGFWQAYVAWVMS